MTQIVTKMIAALTDRIICPKCRHLQSRSPMSRPNKIRCDQCGHLFLKEHFNNSSGFWEK